MTQGSGWKTVIVIPARYGSTRLPGKAMLPIGGEPMVVRVWRKCCLAKDVERVLVATDDERIRDAVRGAGGEAVMTSASHVSGTDRVAEAVKDMECDAVVNVQGDEPFIEPGAIAKAVDLLRRENAPPAGTLACPVRSIEELVDPSVVKVVIGQDGNALYFSRLPVPYRGELWESSPEVIWQATTATSVSTHSGRAFCRSTVPWSRPRRKKRRSWNSSGSSRGVNE
jgi:3-deoxy-manno-octulosonate cytidylyltransferase (CMP-KDO synthetase)